MNRCPDSAQLAGQNALEVALADHLAHGTFRHVLHRLLGILDAEEVLLGILNAPDDDERHLDDVLVAGQHAAFLGHVGRTRGPAAYDARAETDLDRVLAGHLGEADFLDRVGQAEVQSRRLLAHELAEAQNDAKLVGLNAERERIKASNGDADGREEEEQRARNARSRHHLLEAVLAAPQKLFKVRLLAAAAAGRALSPGATTAAAFPSAAPASLIAPRHYHALLRCWEISRCRTKSLAPAPPGMLLSI
mgnify:CR=1 FL=1